MKKLKSLSIPHCGVTGTGFSQLKGKLPILHGLMLGYGKCNDEGVAAIAEFIRSQPEETRHENLDFESTPVTDKGLAGLTGLQFSTLALSGTEITNDCLSKLPDVRNTLQVYRTAISYEALVDYQAKHPKLHIMDTNRQMANAVLDQGGTVQIVGVEETIDAKSKLPPKLFRIESISMDGTDSKDSTVLATGLSTFYETLKWLPDLKSLSIRNTQITEKGVAHLKKMLPNCEIIHD